MSFGVGWLVSKAANFLLSEGIAKAVTNTISNWWEGKQQRALLAQQSKTRIQEARANAEIEKIRADTQLYADNDSRAIEQWRYTLIDEILVISILLLIACTFIPELQPAVQKGIALLNDYPLWLQVIIGGTYISILGLRFIFLAPIAAIFGKAKVRVRVPGRWGKQDEKDNNDEK